MLILIEDFLNKAEQKLAEQSRKLLNGYLHDKVSSCLADSVELLAETIQTVEGATQEEAQSLMAFAMDYFDLIDVPIGAYNKVRNEIIGSSNNGYSIPIPLAHINQEELEAYVTSLIPVGSNVVVVDTPTNWVNTNQVIPLGQLGYAYNAGGIVMEARLGVNLPWDESPLIYSAFIPVVTNNGRDMNNPGGARIPLNLQTEREAWKYVLEPYSPPSLALSYITDYGSAFPVREVGDALTIPSQTFGIGVNHISSILEEGAQGSELPQIYIDAVPRVLASDVDGDDYVIQTVTKAINADSAISSDVIVLTATVKREDTLQPISNLYVMVPFRYNSGYFLHTINEDLTEASQERIMEVVNEVKALGDFDKVRHSGIDYKNTVFDGNKGFGYVTFDTDMLDGKLYHIYIFNPRERGYPSIAAATSSTAKSEVRTADFVYKNGTAEVDYVLTRMDAPIQGEYPAYIE